MGDSCALGSSSMWSGMCVSHAICLTGVAPVLGAQCTRGFRPNGNRETVESLQASDGDAKFKKAQQFLIKIHVR